MKLMNSMQQIRVTSQLVTETSLTLFLSILGLTQTKKGNIYIVFTECLYLTSIIFPGFILFNIAQATLSGITKLIQIKL